MTTPFCQIPPCARDKPASAVYTVRMEAKRIRVLPPDVAKRIAAGEVIDRPAAALRELLDNALDSGARNIVVEMQGGGIELLRVVDDGSGMGKDDLSLSILPHATSKISALDDLLSLSTLGFRGEALSSMASVARVEIVSAIRDDEAWRLDSVPDGTVAIVPSRGSRGTHVTIRELFANFPARRKFLKRASAEASACKAVFVDKAMAFPEVAFKLSSDSRLLLALRPSGLAERVLAASLPAEAPGLYRELIANGTGFKAKIVASLPAIHRNDRRHLQVFINGRKVQDYGLAQALEYGYHGYLPGAAWPLVYAFIEVDPEYADFNIHPAKKEVRLKNLDEIRAGLIRSIRDYLGAHSRIAPSSAIPGTEPAASSLFSVDDSRKFQYASPPAATFQNAKDRFTGPQPGETANAAEGRLSWAAIAEAAARIRENEPCDTQESLRATTHGKNTVAMADASGFRYLGRALGVFLVFQTGDEVILMDQHAAHERLLYDEIMAGRAISQELLVPVVFEPESDEEDSYIATHAQELAAAGFRLAREGRAWLLESAPALLPEAMTGAIFEILRSRPDPDELLRETAAQAACRAAVKDGDELDETGAVALIRAALALPEPRCPHGRPIWLKLSRDDLFRAVRRLV